MTICIAAIGKCKEDEEEKESIVFSTDHMVSVPLGQFEHAIKKYKKINDNTVAMLAGETLLFEPILDNLPTTGTFNSIKKKINENMNKILKQRINDDILKIYGVKHKFIEDCLKSPVQNPFVAKILETISEFSLKTGILLIGFQNGEAQISEINENRIVDFRDINFNAIGSGATQAINTMLFQKHSKVDDLKTTIYNVYKSKRNAEVAQGVGDETEMLILTKGNLYVIEKNEMDLLSKLYEKELKWGKTNPKLEEITKNIDGDIK